MNHEPGLTLKSGFYSNGKTVNSIRALMKFDPYEVIQITNQPTGYNHIFIQTPGDLVELVEDIFHYNYYYNGYASYVEQYELLKTAKENLKKYEFHELNPRALNLLKDKNWFQRFKTNIRISLGLQLSTNITPSQIDPLMCSIEKYFKEREEFTKMYGEDLLLDYMNIMSLDELHLYFGAREFTTNFKDKPHLMEFISFPVKLRTKIEGICQSVYALDIMFRRQSSRYIRHSLKFFGLLQVTEEYLVTDPEKPSYEDSELISTKRNFNWYKLFGFPKVQYYRTHIIRPKADDVYTKGDYFRHIMFMTEAMKKEIEAKEALANKQERDTTK